MDKKTLKITDQVINSQNRFATLSKRYDFFASNKVVYEDKTYVINHYSKEGKKAVASKATPYGALFWGNRKTSPTYFWEMSKTDDNIKISEKSITKVNRINTTDKEGNLSVKLNFVIEEKMNYFSFEKNGDLEINFNESALLPENLLASLSCSTGITIKPLKRGYSVLTDFGNYFFTKSFKRVGDEVFTDGCVIEANSTRTLKEHTTGPVYDDMKSMTKDIVVIRESLKLVETLGGLKQNDSYKKYTRADIESKINKACKELTELTTKDERIKYLEDKYKTLLECFEGTKQVSFPELLLEVISFSCLCESAKHRVCYGTVYGAERYYISSFITKDRISIDSATISKAIHTAKRNLIRYKHFYLSVHSIKDWEELNFIEFE